MWHHVNVSASDHVLSNGKPASVDAVSLSQLCGVVKALLKAVPHIIMISLDHLQTSAISLQVIQTTASWQPRHWCEGQHYLQCLLGVPDANLAGIVHQNRAR